MSGVGRTYWLWVGLLVLVHFLVRPSLTGAAWLPDLLTGAVLVAALGTRAGLAAALGFVLGLLEGAMALGGLGGTALVYTLLGYLTARWRDLFFADLPFLLFFYLFMGCWLTRLVMTAVTGLELTWSYALGGAPLSAALTAVICGAGTRLVVAPRVR